jgi:hypothetical protein
MGVGAEEADESAGWLDLMQRLGLSSSPELASLRRESEELLAIFSASQLTARMNLRRELEGKRLARRA